MSIAVRDISIFGALGIAFMEVSLGRIKGAAASAFRGIGSEFMLVRVTFPRGSTIMMDPSSLKDKAYSLIGRSILSA
ncbi:hypothetical protein [Arthrobacter sp. Soil736]|uniref:hypothetical protein n=1 Tax=Arthrobacter sp. Soil736 TaxID=1736395 RepID=UPI00138ED969|nr:hypothetical protein [Arthrobacter sp. Soil736]